LVWVSILNTLSKTVRNSLLSLNGKVEKMAEVNEVLWAGCGACATDCPAGAITVKHFTDQQILAQIEGVLAT